MRKVILPVLLLLAVFISSVVYAQPGQNCANAYDIPLDESCPINPYDGDPFNSIPPDGIATGSRAYCTNTPDVANGKVVWFKFRPTDISKCVRIKIDAKTEAGVYYPTEIAFYTNCTTLNATGSMCFADGKGIWSPPASFVFMSQDYYLRVFIFYNGADRVDIETCGKQYVPENDDCLDAMPIPLEAPPPASVDPLDDDNVCGQTNNQERDAIFGAGGMPYNDAKAICAQTLQNTSWYRFTVSGGSAQINISGVECDTYNNAAGNYIQAGLLKLKPGRTCKDGGTGAAGPWTTVSYSGAAPPNQMPRSPNAACVNLPRSAAQGGGNSAILTTENLPPGTVVYLAIDGYDGANCKYKIGGLSNITPIPISLKDFIVWKKVNSNLVTWTTVWERDNDYFEVQRSSDGMSFSSIGNVNGNNTSSLTMGYSFEDQEPYLVTYYRLKQVDNDGNFTYSKVVMIRRETSRSLLTVTIANPVYASSKLVISSRRGGSTNLRIVSSTGENIHTQMLSLMPGNTTLVKDFSKLPAGAYYLVITQGDEKIVKPFIKQ